MTDALLSETEVQQGVASLHPFRGIGRPEDIAKVYVFLASDDAGWMTGVSTAGTCDGMKKLTDVIGESSCRRRIYCTIVIDRLPRNCEPLQTLDEAYHDHFKVSNLRSRLYHVP